MGKKKVTQVVAIIVEARLIGHSRERELGGKGTLAGELEKAK